MKCLGVISEYDVFLDRQRLADSDYKDKREAVRFVVFDKNNRIALNYRPKQKGYEELYAIPGGGIEAGEVVIDALKREALEEVGCSLINIVELGCVIEYGVSKGLVQRTYVFTASVYEKLGPNYTKDEIASNLSTVWLSFDDAYKTMRNSTNSFSKHRSLLILSNINHKNCPE